ncbi:hypothetical protein [Flavobacterium notoginsengisoli]|uniref:hypothetical protein n=1 Tax=Flavobacterium notoginsengisoli TaxID=1478199 RepID=UPI003626CE9D
MNLKNHSFFKKYRYFKYFLLVHLFFSVLIFISQLVHGVINGSIIEQIKKPYQNYTALSNPEKYLKTDFFVLDTAFTEKSSSDKNSSSVDTFIKGNLLHSKTKKEIIYQGNHLAVFYRERLKMFENGDLKYVSIKKKKIIPVWKSILNDTLFLKSKKHLSDQKANAITIIYVEFSIILIIIILVFLKNKSKLLSNNL